MIRINIRLPLWIRKTICHFKGHANWTWTPLSEAHCPRCGVSRLEVQPKYKEWLIQEGYIEE